METHVTKEEPNDPPFLTKEAFERLLRKAAQPISEWPSQEAEQTSEPHQNDG